MQTSSSCGMGVGAEDSFQLSPYTGVSLMSKHLSPQSHPGGPSKPSWWPHKAILVARHFHIVGGLCSLCCYFCLEIRIHVSHTGLKISIWNS